MSDHYSSHQTRDDLLFSASPVSRANRSIELDDFRDRITKLTLKRSYFLGHRIFGVASDKEHPIVLSGVGGVFGKWVTGVNKLADPFTEVILTHGASLFVHAPVELIAATDRGIVRVWLCIASLANLRCRSQ